MYLRKITLTGFLIFCFLFGFGQAEIKLNSTTNGTVQTGCSFLFFDDGGGSANYANGYDYSITFKSQSTVNTHMKLSFASFDIDESDTLYIYDGPTTASPIIGRYNNSNPLVSPNSIVQASLSNSTGQITIRFKSSSADFAAGWNASVSCTPQCQTVIAAADLNSFSPQPNSENYIDICLGDTITFAAAFDESAFPENDILYHQDSSTTTYSWSFGDMQNATGKTVKHVYTAANGYDVYLTMSDVKGCTNTTLMNFRVRISDNPIVSIKDLPDICIGDTIDLVVGEMAVSTIVVSPTQNTTMATERYDSTTFIPDGPNCSIECYNTPVLFTNFSPSATIQSAADITSICINMEHSFAGDLSFRIVCPNGSSVELDSYAGNGGGSGGAEVGEMIDDGDDMTNSSCNDECNPECITPGTGWTYCWSESYPNSGILNGNLDLSSVGVIPATDTINHTGYIQPENSLAGLIGCPLNGTWSIEVCDHWSLDNGFVFWWDLTLQNQQNYSGWNYQVQIDSVTWAGPYIFGLTDSTGMIVPPDSAGSHNYTATVWDEYGCTYDQEFVVEVLDNPKPYLGVDTAICSGSTLILDAGNIATSYEWSTGETSQTIEASVSGEYRVAVTNANDMQSCYGYDTIVISYIEPPIVDLGADFDMCKHETQVLGLDNPDGYDYFWSTGATTQQLYLESPPIGENVIFVNVIGCDSIRDTVVVNVLPCDLIISNVLTPQPQDGMNDVFKINGIEYYPNSELKIFNRWGKCVYKNEDYGSFNAWDGENLAEGTYFYVLSVNYGNGDTDELNGTITILRK